MNNQKEKPTPKKKLLSLENASEYLNISKSCLYRLTSTKRITHYKPNGKKIYFQESDLESWVLRNRVVAS